MTKTKSAILEAVHETANKQRFLAAQLRGNAGRTAQLLDDLDVLGR